MYREQLVRRRYSGSIPKVTGALPRGASHRGFARLDSLRG
jgi:hypothetical protein